MSIFIYLNPSLEGKKGQAVSFRNYQFKKGTVDTWTGPEDLNGKVGWIRGYAFNEYLDVPVDFYETNSRQSGLKMLEAGRLKFFLDTEAELLGALEEGYINPDDYQVEVIIRLNVHLAFAGTERGKTLKQIFDKRMAELVASGELHPLYEQWELRYPFDD